MLIDRVQMRPSSPQMGPRSSFGWAFGPLERAQDVQFNIVMENIGL